MEHGNKNGTWNKDTDMETNKYYKNEHRTWNMEASIEQENKHRSWKQMAHRNENGNKPGTQEMNRTCKRTWNKEMDMETNKE